AVTAADSPGACRPVGRRRVHLCLESDLEPGAPACGLRARKCCHSRARADRRNKSPSFFGRNMGVSYYVDLHVLVNGNISVHEGHTLTHRVKDAIRATDPRIADVLVHIEPANL